MRKLKPEAGGEVKQQQGQHGGRKHPRGRRPAGCLFSLTHDQSHINGSGFGGVSTRITIHKNQRTNRDLPSDDETK
jgi:hypothetical protein